MNAREEVDRIQAEQGLSDDTVIDLLCDFIDDKDERDFSSYFERRAKGEPHQIWNMRN